MGDMTTAGRISHGAGLAAAVVLLAGGCGGQPSVTPAGSAGLEVPYDDAAPGAKRNPSAAPTVPGATPLPAIPLPSGTFSPPKPVKPGKSGTPKPGVPVPAAPGGLVLPALGGYTYALTGTSSLGKPPAILKLQVEPAGGAGEQIWTLDGRRDDGAGIIEELTLGRQDDGVYLSAYRLDASTGIAAIVLEFAPATPVLLEPDGARPGQTWAFDLESKDGCAAARTEGVLVSEARSGEGAASLRHIRLTTTLKTIGPPTCPAVTAKRIQDTYHAAGTLLPTRLDSDLSGSLGAIPVKANTKATLTSPTPKSAARKPDID